MLNELDYAIIAFGRKIIHMLPFGDTHIQGFAVGEMAWIITLVAIAEQAYFLYEKVKR